MSGPYSEAAWLYWRAGWKGVLPLRPGTKWPPPTGFSGHTGDWPDPGWIQRWVDEQPDGNIALRMPDDVIGLDVDAYADKGGGRTLDDLIGQLGPLPDTIMSTSRGNGRSGIMLFRCRPQHWPGVAGAGIEMIHHGHRYAVVWPSIHPEGRTYQWIDQQTGRPIDRAPRPDELPWLPQAWADHLLEKAARPADKADVDDQIIKAWLAGLREGDPCECVEKEATRVIAELDEGKTARHDCMRDGSARLVAYGANGHAGVAAGLTDVHKAFMAAVTAGDGARKPREAHGEWRRALSGAVAMQVEDHPAPAADCSCIGVFDPRIEEEFWSERPALDHIRMFARARRASPWAVLGVVLTRLISCIPPHYVLPPIVGGHVSLNLFVAIVAPSGGGKGAAEAAAIDCVDVGEKVQTAGVGSGEGILHQFVRRVRGKAAEQHPGGLEQHTTSVLFTAAEVDTLGALADRRSSTLLAEFRKVYMGEQLGFAYVDDSKRLTVERNAYRAGLIVGVQPTRGGVLLDDSDGGTPQRFLWMPGLDPDIPDVAPPEPEPYTWNKPTALPHLSRPDGLVLIDVCEAAVKEIDAGVVARHRGEGDALDGHLLLTRLKWATALAVLDERLEVTDDDWRLAGILIDKSVHVREEVGTELSRQKASINRAQGRAAGERDLARDEIVGEASIRQVCGRLLRKLQSGPATRSTLRRHLTSKDREWFEAAIERLVEAGIVDEQSQGQGVLYSARGVAA